VIVKWEKMTDLLLERAYEQRKRRVGGRWKGMVSKLAKRGEIKLKTFADLGT